MFETGRKKGKVLGDYRYSCLINFERELVLLEAKIRKLIVVGKDFRGVRFFGWKLKLGS